jgi:hypothetical protein
VEVRRTRLEALLESRICAPSFAVHGAKHVSYTLSSIPGPSVLFTFIAAAMASKLTLAAVTGIVRETFVPFVSQDFESYSLK